MVRLLDGVGADELASRAARTVVQAGGQVAIIGNAERFDPEAPTRVLFVDAEVAASAELLAEALGVEAEQIESSGADPVYDVTVIVGADLLRAYGLTRGRPFPPTPPATTKAPREPRPRHPRRHRALGGRGRPRRGRQEGRRHRRAGRRVGARHHRALRDHARHQLPPGPHHRRRGRAAPVGEAGGPKPIRIEGLDDLSWVLMDYGDFVVHVFSEEARHFYELERLWADVPKVDWAASRRAAAAAAGTAAAWRSWPSWPSRRRRCRSTHAPAAGVVALESGQRHVGDGLVADRQHVEALFGRPAGDGGEEAVGAVDAHLPGCTPAPRRRCRRRSAAAPRRRGRTSSTGPPPPPPGRRGGTLEVEDDVVELGQRGLDPAPSRQRVGVEQEQRGHCRHRTVRSARRPGPGSTCTRYGDRYGDREGDRDRPRGAAGSGAAARRGRAGTLGVRVRPASHRRRTRRRRGSGSCCSMRRSRPLGGPLTDEERRWADEVLGVARVGPAPVRSPDGGDRSHARRRRADRARTQRSAGPRAGCPCTRARRRPGGAGHRARAGASHAGTPGRTDAAGAPADHHGRGARPRQRVAASGSCWPRRRPRTWLTHTSSCAPVVPVTRW